MSNRQVKGHGLLGQQPNGGHGGSNNNNTNNSNGGRGRGSYNKYSRGAGTGGSSSATRRKPVPQQQQQPPQQPSMYGGVMKEHNQQKQRSEKDAETLELEKTAKLNSDVCARMDSKFSELIKVAAQVALYEYDCPTSSWKPCNTRGSLFLYKRVVEPYLGLFILNRNSLENFALMITPQIEMQVVKPYIMMKTTEAIRCFWFYSEDECVEIANLINKQVGIPVKTETEVVKKKDSPMKPGSGPADNHNNKPQCRASGDGAAAAAGGSNSIFVPGNEGSHILNLLCNKVSSAKQNNNVVQKKEAEEEKISCQNRKPGQKGLTQQELDSLGEELRATLGIINAPMMMTELLGSGDHNLIMMDGDHSDEESQEQMTINSTFLNMEQMLQATLHLLKTEQGFAGKLEAAYMNSLSDS